MKRVLRIVLAGLLAGVWAMPLAAVESKKIVLLAGTPSHGPGEHEHNAGCLLLKQCLDRVPSVQAIVYTNGWPKDPKAFDGADAIVIYCDGGGGHMAIQDERLS
jgi:hypothetical protein